MRGREGREGGGVERHNEREEGLEPGRHGGQHQAGAGQARQDPAQGADEAGEGGRGQDGQPGSRLHSPPPLCDDSQGGFQCFSGERGGGGDTPLPALLNIFSPIHRWGPRRIFTQPGESRVFRSQRLSEDKFTMRYN